MFSFIAEEMNIYDRMVNEREKRLRGNFLCLTDVLRFSILFAFGRNLHVLVKARENSHFPGVVSLLRFN